MINEKIKTRMIHTHRKQYVIAVFFSLFSLLFSLSSCNEPVFYTVSMQEKILPPIVSGTPTGFAQISDYMYVASGDSIYGYNITDETWVKKNLNLNRITALVGRGSNIFIIANNRIYVSNDPLNSSFIQIIPTSTYRFLTMYVANNEIFVGARDADQKSLVLRISGTNILDFGFAPVALTDIEEVSTNFILRGVAHNSSYFFVIKDTYNTTGGIFSGNTSSASLIQNYNIPFMGIISIGSNVIAIDLNGQLYDINTSSITPIQSTGRRSNGTLFIWNDPTNLSNSLLLAGRLDNPRSNTRSGFTYGYVEAEITSGNLTSGFREPGLHSISTIEQSTGNNERFKTTIGKFPVNFFFQTSGSTPILFASTQNEGVWAIRNRGSGDPYWNTEN